MIASADALLLSLAALFASPSIWGLKPLVETARNERLKRLPLFEQEDSAKIKEAEVPLGWLASASRLLFVSGVMILVYYLSVSESNSLPSGLADLTTSDLWFNIGALILFLGAAEVAIVSEFIHDPQTGLVKVVSGRVFAGMTFDLVQTLAYGLLIAWALFWEYTWTNGLTEMLPVIQLSLFNSVLAILIGVNYFGAAIIISTIALPRLRKRPYLLVAGIFLVVLPLLPSLIYILATSL